MRILSVLFLALVPFQAGAFTLLPPRCQEADGKVWDLNYKLAEGQFLVSRLVEASEVERLVLCDQRTASLEVISPQTAPRRDDGSQVYASSVIVAAAMSSSAYTTTAIRDLLRQGGLRARLITYPRDGCVCEQTHALIDLTDPVERANWSREATSVLPGAD